MNMGTAENTTYSVGTLSYTRWGLVNIFVWLLWGDFCFSMMEILIPVLLPLFLKQHDASATTIGIIVGSIPALLNFIINPIVSTCSDRTRSRWGRRIPYLFFTSPFVTLFLILLGWSDDIGAWLQASVLNGGFSVSAVVISLVIFFAIGFQVFNMFVSSVFYYIFADVVPEQFMGRFMAAFRVVGTLAGFIFHKFILGHAKEHMPWIFTIVALIYLVSFSLMCLRVKEGEYPPVRKDEKKPNMFQLAQTYFRECFSIPFYLWMFIGTALNSVSMICRTMFGLLFATEDLGLALGQVGHISATATVLTMCMLLPAGLLVDRLHPLRLYCFGGFLIVAVNVFSFFYANDYLTYFIVVILNAVVYITQTASGLPLFAALLPREKYGQFCSAQAMVQAVIMIAANAGGGVFIDIFGYRYIYVWDFGFTSIATAAMLVVYCKWKRLGGDRGYVAPLSWADDPALF